MRFSRCLRKHKPLIDIPYRAIHDEKTAKLIQSAKFLFRAAGKRVYISNNTNPNKPLTLQSIAETKRASKTSTWTEQHSTLFGYPRPSIDQCSDSPPWLKKIPLKEVSLYPLTEQFGLLPGLTFSYPKAKEKSPQVAVDLTSLRESISIHGPTFPTHLGRLLTHPERREEIVVDIARSILDLCGYTLDGMYYTGRDSEKGPNPNKMITHLGTGSSRIRVVSVPDFVLWKNFLGAPGFTEVVGTAFCEIKRDYRYFYWPQIYGELLSVAAARNAAGLFNPDGSIDSYSIGVSGFSVRIISARFPLHYFENFTLDAAPPEIEIHCWPKEDKFLSIEEDRKEILQALTAFRHHVFQGCHTSSNN